MAIKLTSKNKLRNETFYFNNIEDCRIFMDVFKDHWCNIIWEKPIEVPDCSIPYEELGFNNKDPKKRAEDNLSWGFNSLWANPLDGGLNAKQQAFIDEFIGG